MNNARKIKKNRHEFWIYNQKGQRYVYFGWHGKSYTWDKFRGQDLAFNTCYIILFCAALLIASMLLALPTPFGD